jgi:cytoskeletal protein RodZ
VTFEELSQELRKARLAKKWRPRDIARRTRIQYEYIKLIESGDFTFMPETIIRGYIKSYSRDVGLDQNEMIEKYEQAKSQTQKDSLKPKPEAIKPKEKKVVKNIERKIEIPKDPEPDKRIVVPKKQVEKPEEKKIEKVDAKKVEKKEPDISTIIPIEMAKPVTDKKQLTKEEPIKEKLKVETPKKSVDPERVPKKEKIKAKKTVVVKPKNEALQKFYDLIQKFRGEIVLAGLLLAVIIVIVLIYLKFGTDYFSKEEKPVQKISVFEAREQNLEEETAKKVEEEQIRVPETVKLKILAAEETWFRLITDSTETSEFIFQPGESRSFEAKNQMELKMGRADGLFIWVNEDSLGKLGTAGEIVGKLVIGPQGIITKEVRAPQPSSPTRRDTTIVLFP